MTEQNRRIANVLYRLAWAYDTNDRAELEACFTDDASVTWHGGTTKDGRDAIVAELLRRRGRYTDTLPWHVVSSVHVLSETADSAVVRSRYTFSVQRSEGAPQLTAVGWYDDTLALDDGAWRISQRRLMPATELSTPATAAPSTLEG